MVVDHGPCVHGPAAASQCTRKQSLLLLLPSPSTKLIRSLRLKALEGRGRQRGKGGDPNATTQSLTHSHSLTRHSFILPSLPSPSLRQLARRHLAGTSLGRAAVARGLLLVRGGAVLACVRARACVCLACVRACTCVSVRW